MGWPGPATGKWSVRSPVGTRRSQPAAPRSSVEEQAARRRSRPHCAEIQDTFRLRSENTSWIDVSSEARVYQRDESRVEQQLCLLYPHGHHGQSLVGSVVGWELRAAHQRARFHQAVHVDWKHLHGVRQDQLWTQVLLRNSVT